MLHGREGEEGERKREGKKKNNEENKNKMMNTNLVLGKYEILYTHLYTNIKDMCTINRYII